MIVSRSVDEFNRNCLVYTISCNPMQVVNKTMDESKKSLLRKQMPVDMGSNCWAVVKLGFGLGFSIFPPSN